MYDSGSTAFMLVCTMLVLFMTPGLAFFYGGLARRKNVVNTMLMCFAAIGVVVSLLIQGIVEGWMNFVSIYVCPLGAGLAGILFYWVYGEKFVREQLQKGRAKPIGRWLGPMTKYVFCGLTIAVFILGVLTPGGIG